MRGVVAAGAAGLLVLGVAAADAAAAGPGPVVAPLACPAPYTPREVRVYGQRIESDATRDGTTAHVVAQNDWVDPKDQDPRYVVALVCTRVLNNTENSELYRWGSR